MNTKYVIYNGDNEDEVKAFLSDSESLKECSLSDGSSEVPALLIHCMFRYPSGKTIPNDFVMIPGDILVRPQGNLFRHPQAAVNSVVATLKALYDKEEQIQRQD